MHRTDDVYDESATVTMNNEYEILLFLRIFFPETLCMRHSVCWDPVTSKPASQIKLGSDAFNRISSAPGSRRENSLSRLRLTNTRLLIMHLGRFKILGRRQDASVAVKTNNAICFVSFEIYSNPII